MIYIYCHLSGPCVSTEPPTPEDLDYFRDEAIDIFRIEPPSSVKRWNGTDWEPVAGSVLIDNIHCPEEA